MNRTRLVRTVCLVLALLMIATLVLPLVLQTSAETPQQKLDRLQQELQATQNKIDANKNNIKKQEEVKQYYTQKKTIIQQQMETLRQEIENTQAALNQKQEELAQKVQDVANTQELFNQRMVSMYTSKNDDTLSILLGAQSFSAALRYAENLKKIAENDTELLERLRKEQAELEQQKADFEAQLEQQRANEAELDRLRQEYANSIVQADNSITQQEADMEANQEAYQQKYDEVQRAKAELDAWIQSNNNVDFEYGGGPFTWPCPGFNRISSDFGMRTLYGKPDFHRGVDMSAAAGTPIYAAAAGKVSTTAHWSYGNCVKISHGSGLVTVYAHMLSRAVSNGEIVAQGQLIGYVGSTGNSTGNHLHFEVNLNGQVVSPWPYLNG